MLDSAFLRARCLSPARSRPFCADSDPGTGRPRIAWPKRPTRSFTGSPRPIFDTSARAICLQPTALVNEAWQKFVALDAVELSDRVHFLSLCSRLMRQVLVDHARRRATHERAVESMRIDDRIEADALDLDLALRKLEEAQPRAARVVELRYFGGMSTEEIAECLDVSLATVKRDWLAARAWLYSQLHGDQA